MSGLLDKIRGSLRYKLLVLVLLPILVVVPAALLLSGWWGLRFTYEQLFFKVNTDLNVAHDAFERVQRTYLDRLRLLGERQSLRSSLDVHNRTELRRQLEAFRREAGFSYLLLIDARGRRLDREDDAQTVKSSPLLLAATLGVARSGIELFAAQELKAIDPWLLRQVELELLPTPRARPTQRRQEDRGMMIRALYPLKNAAGEVQALLDGGVLLNRNFAFVDGIRDLVYGPGSLIEGSIGTVTVFLEDVRISTNVPLKEGERALGTRVSDEVRRQVLDEGRIWIDRAFVVNDWYISAYEPIVDTAGSRIGMLYAGYLESPYRNALLAALAILALLFVILMLLAGYVAIRGARGIFRPVEAMNRVIEATRRGERARIGELDSHDELGTLAREFDTLLDQLQAHQQRIEQSAQELESKVEERTAELQRSNRELRNTVQVLRETRRQLLEAEKLAALGELTAGVAHEINNPTAVMLGAIDSVIDELKGRDDALVEDLELAIRQIYRIRDIVDRLLQYARPGSYAGFVENIDVNEAIHSALSLVQHMRKTHEFALELDLRATRRIGFNRQELQQVLVNLLVNAIHALPAEAGVIEITSCDWEDRGVIIEVRDNGHGIGESDIDHIFNPFYTRKPEGEGSGLGLSVSYSLVRRYGGLISVESEPGKGALFTLHLLSDPEFHEDEETLMEQLVTVVKAAGSKTDKAP